MKKIFFLSIISINLCIGQDINSIEIIPNGVRFPRYKTTFPTALGVSHLIYSDDEIRNDGTGYYNHNGSTWVKVKQAGANNIPISGNILSETLNNNNLEGIGTTKTGIFRLNFEGWEKNITSNLGFGLSNSKPIYTNNGTSIIFWGGSTTSPCIGFGCVPTTTYYNTGKFYSYATDTWTNLPASTLSARSGHSMVWANTIAKMIIFGGYDGTNYLSNTAIMSNTLNPASGTWTNASSNNSPNERSGHSAIAYPDQSDPTNKSIMLIWGGKNGTTAFSDGKKFNTSTGWFSTSINSATAPSARHNHIAVLTSDNDKMVIFGGETFSGTDLDDGKVYDISADTWSPMAAVPSGVYVNDGSAICFTQAKICVHGSKFTGDNLGAVYTIQTNTWQTMTDENGPHLKNHSAIFHPLDHTKIVVMGGTNTDTNTLNTKVFTYDLTENKWLTPLEEQVSVTPSFTKPFLIPIGTNLDSSIFAWKPSGSTLISISLGGIFKPISNKTFYTFKKR
jgi:hypothetical protein